MRPFERATVDALSIRWRSLGPVGPFSNRSFSNVSLLVSREQLATVLLLSGHLAQLVNYLSRYLHGF